MIRDLRELGGVWTSERIGFGYFRYLGQVRGHDYTLQSYAHMAPRFDGDDESFVSRWHITRDGEPVGYQFSSSTAAIEELRRVLGTCGGE